MRFLPPVRERGGVNFFAEGRTRSAQGVERGGSQREYGDDKCQHCEEFRRWAWHFHTKANGA